MFVLNYTHVFRHYDGSTTTIPQGTEVYPTSCKYLWDKSKSGKRMTARYFIEDICALKGIKTDLNTIHSGKWWDLRGYSFHSHKVSRISKKQFQDWKATRLDTTMHIG